MSDLGTFVSDASIAERYNEELEAIKGTGPIGAGPTYNPDEFEDKPKRYGDTQPFRDSRDKRVRFLELVNSGMLIKEACESMGMTIRNYQKWRTRWPIFAAKVDEAKQYSAEVRDAWGWNGTAGSFIATFFKQKPTWFQLMILEELANTPPGNILLVLIPPEHGKTTTFENFASMTLALTPAYRFLVCSENQGIAKKINGRVMDRMNVLGPFPKYVHEFGPFVPQTGSAATNMRQPWTDAHFRVYKARTADERNFSMEAVGANGSIVSARCDKLAVDDIQSLKTLTQTARITAWLRQDALSRPAETGNTAILGTRVGDEDVYAELLNDPDLDDILRVIRFPAIITDRETGEQKPLWEGKHTMESLDRMRRKAGQEIWDRNWMQDPGVSRIGHGTFTETMVDNCLDINRSLEHHVGDEGDRTDSPVYIAVDPALGGKNCVMAAELLPEGSFIVRRIREDVGFERNEQIMTAIESVVRWSNMTGIVTDVIIEDKNFQLGLKNDERMIDMANKYGFNIRGHNTGWNKYDPDIGVASMASTFIRKEIILPWADDDLTRLEIKELRRQLLKWKPGVKGKTLRQDRVMCLWFIWMLWRSRHKSIEGLSNNGNGFKRDTGRWKINSQGLMVPAGAR